jgi:hypothetical protein
MYDVSTFGNVRSWYVQQRGRGADFTRAAEPMLLKAWLELGYSTVGLYHGRCREDYRVHRLVLETFVGPCPDGMLACHGVNGRLDNSLVNLSWDTQANNLGRDRLRDGTHQWGDQNPSAKLSNSEVDTIKALWVARGCTQQEIADMFGISRGHVSAIVNGRRRAGPS